ncbi:hypothetical protein [Bdellovibrio sp. HCB337]|uniref:hypothetical protein n=1 Tax=Bdellovibrio sp. HCB337 TaxID=3394358 RepID=UPI0039A5D1A7
MKAFLAILFLASGSFSWADSTEFGNGGSAVVCTLPIRMYDAVEAKARYGMEPVLPKGPSADYCQKQNDNCTLVAKTIVSRLKKMDPQLETILQSLVNNFWSEAMLTYYDLLPVHDTGVGFIERGCELKQLAIQHRPLFEEDRRYFIDRKIWDHMFDDQRAVLIVHEVLYNYALQLLPETNSSEKIRYFNALLLSNKISVLAPEKYQVIKAKVFPTTKGL